MATKKACDSVAELSSTKRGSSSAKAGENLTTNSQPCADDDTRLV
jgi:hypothetical protein